MHQLWIMDKQNVIYPYHKRLLSNKRAKYGRMLQMEREPQKY